MRDPSDQYWPPPAPGDEERPRPYDEAQGGWLSAEPEPRLWRSRRDKMVAGVLGGLAEKYGMESKPLRLLYGMLTIFSGGLLAIPYAALWSVTRMRGAAPVRTGRWRSKHKKVIAGVLGGLAERYGTSARLLRLLFFVIAVVTGVVPGVLTYLLLWAVTKEDELPYEPGYEQRYEPGYDSRENRYDDEQRWR